MTRETAQKLLPVIQAFAEGKPIEWRMSDKSDWRECHSPTWDVDCDYRIKPREPREFAICLHRNGTTVLQANPMNLDGKSSADYGGYSVIKVREILPDETP